MGITLRLLGIGWYVALTILCGGFVGRWFDRWLGHDPLFTILGLGAGLSIAIIGMYRMLVAVLSKTSNLEK